MASDFRQLLCPRLPSELLSRCPSGVLTVHAGRNKTTHISASCCVGGRKWPDTLIGMRFLRCVQPPTLRHTPASQVSWPERRPHSATSSQNPSCQPYPCLCGVEKNQYRDERQHLRSLPCMQGGARHAWGGPCGQGSRLDVTLPPICRARRGAQLSRRN